MITRYFLFCSVLISLLFSCNKVPSNSDENSAGQRNVEFKKKELYIFDEDKIVDELIFSSYSESLINTLKYKSNCSQLSKLLFQLYSKSHNCFKDKKIEEQISTSAFPYNVIWLMSQIGDKPTKRYLSNFKHLHKEYDWLIDLAIKSIELREVSKKNNLRIFYLEEAKLLTKASRRSKIVKQIKKGCVLIELDIVSNPNEENARGGIQFYQKVMLFSSGQIGFLPLKGDDFPQTI